MTKDNIVNSFGISSDQLKKGVRILRKMSIYGGRDYNPPLIFESTCIGNEWNDFGSRILQVTDSKIQKHDERIGKIISVTTDVRAIYFDDVVKIL